MQSAAALLKILIVMWSGAAGLAVIMIYLAADACAWLTRCLISCTVANLSEAFNFFIYGDFSVDFPSLCNYPCPHGYLFTCAAGSWELLPPSLSPSIWEAASPEKAALRWWYNMLLVIAGSLALKPWQSSQFCWSSLAQWGFISSAWNEERSIRVSWVVR